jgi:hypothetical protein
MGGRSEYGQDLLCPASGAASAQFNAVPAAPRRFRCVAQQCRIPLHATTRRDAFLPHSGDTLVKGDRRPL